MLSKAVLDEIFNVRFHVSDQAIDHISDELDKFRCTISHVEDNDLAVTIHFGRQMNGMPSVEGKIRIDRITGSFEIVGICGGYMMPIEGDWSTILEYLRQLTSPPEEDHSHHP